MNKDEFFAKSREFLAKKKKLSVEEVSPEAHLVETGLVDSLLMTELILFIEDLTGKEIDIETFELSRFTSLSAIYENYVK